MQARLVYPRSSRYPQGAEFYIGNTVHGTPMFVPRVGDTITSDNEPWLVAKVDWNLTENIIYVILKPTAHSS